MGVIEGVEVKPGADEEALKQAGAVLHPPEPGPDQGGELADVAFGEVGQGSFQQRPDGLSRFVIVLGSLDRRLSARRLSAEKACSGKAGRGELAVPLPAGYARRASGEVALDPDEQVQAIIRLVFRLFDELGTVHAVLRFLVEHQVQVGMRQRSGPGKGEVAWRAPHQQGLSNMLRNPAYAGIYAYGRSRTDPSRRLPGREHSGRVRRLEAREWLVRIEGAPPAYISVEQYERNLARLAANRARADAAGAPRNGPALLGGLVVCGICGHRLQLNYVSCKGSRHA